MCTYNGEKFLRGQLASIAQQSRSPHELVICDDGSTDSTPAIVEEFSRTAGFPVRFVRNPVNLGSTKNFEKALSLCHGDFIALCDQDDIWLPQKLARQSETMERDSELGGVFCDGQLMQGSSRQDKGRLWAALLFTPGKQKRFNDGEAASVLLAGNVVTGATLMFRGSLRSFILPIPAVWVHDGWIAWMLVFHSKLRAMDTPLIQYRIHDGQQIGIDRTSSGHLPLKKRLEVARREEAAKHMAAVVEFEELRQRASEIGSPRSLSDIHAIDGKIRFLQVRGAEYKNRRDRLVQILRNTHNYSRYERSFKDLIRDISIVLLA